jgi:hypothetical protein
VVAPDALRNCLLHRIDGVSTYDIPPATLQVSLLAYAGIGSAPSTHPRPAGRSLSGYSLLAGVCSSATATSTQNPKP